jgi:hypothetical protein
MDQYIYWHAPLWQALLVFLVSVAFLGWLIRRVLCRPDLSSVLSTINPALSDQALFFFDHVKGITSLNDAAEQTLDNLPVSRQRFLLDALTDTLLEAYEEARVTQQRDWRYGYIAPAPWCMLDAPVQRQPRIPD